MYSEFVGNVFIQARRGFTSTEAHRFLSGQFPDERWLCWFTCHSSKASAIVKLTGSSFADAGQVGDWAWEKVTIDYPGIVAWAGDDKAPENGFQWTGLLRIRGPGGAEFLLFSYLSSLGQIGTTYFVNTDDLKLLNRFASDVAEALLCKGDRIRIRVQGGRDIHLTPESNERGFFPDRMESDITAQVDIFFQKADAFHRLGIPHRRGLLLVGPPGNGKTMMIRRLVRHCHRHYEAKASALKPRKHLDEIDLESFFEDAQEDGPSLCILEDLDSRTQDSEITRAGLLSQLDGLQAREGVLVLGTTNNPGEVDPALIHRPSRFDRVFHFRLPDAGLRIRYLEWAFKGLDRALLQRIAQGTTGWSFAYLNELRVSAAILAIQSGKDSPGMDDLQLAHELLSSQFKAGRKNHEFENAENSVGFSAA